ncbi:hypothetical protein cce_2146 [Crocosphaera subtropica ATCC 51142]|uniref:DGQHR domain-containing protein n=1 Tax=Crocosphaera subtropica (strain ATCC 51142 / BH68) TaxID=43989 RepID=B1WNR7_CROS5|nr:DNA sulfur modification protein DndB [Crocosphaera subtropica]ACB51496.1 hypothetical protein cce_2146 [Crocosphaera subtropica ATCC 51142]
MDSIFSDSKTINNSSDVFSGNISDLVNSELVESIQQSIQPIMVKGYRKGQTFLAVGSQHGKRLMLQINVHASEIPTLLTSRNVPEDSNNPNSGKNRPINDNHVRKIKNYIKERIKADNKWILGTITANIDPEPTKILYQKIWGDLYVAFIFNSTSLEITDGQHRKKAIEQLLSEDRDLMADITFPVNLVLEGDLSQCQTDFRDMAQTLSIPQSLLVAYGGYGKDAIAKEIVEQVNLFRNKTQKIKSTPGSKTGYIYTINYVAKLVSCAFTGKSTDKLSEINTDELVEARAKELSECLNYFFYHYAQIANDFDKDSHWRKMAKLTGEIIEKEKVHWKVATDFRKNCILGISVGLETLGDLLFSTLDRESNQFDRNKVKQLAESIDWSRQGNCWQDTLISPDGKGGIKLNTSRKSVKVAVERCLEVST